MNIEREIWARLPLAQAALELLGQALSEDLLAELFARHRTTHSDHRLAFADLIGLVLQALTQHRGSGRQSFAASRRAGRLTVSDQNVYERLGRIPVPLSCAILRESSLALHALLPVPPQPAGALAQFQIHAVDGKKLKRLAKRMKPLRGVKGRMLGGKVLAGLLLNTGLITTMAANLDGEANDAPLTPELLDQVETRPTQRNLFVMDRQFADLTIPRLIEERGDAWLIRRNKKLGFAVEFERLTTDAQGREVRDAVGWIGAAKNARRRRARQITLVRAEGEDIVLLTSLLDGEQFPAAELLEVYLQRWEIERVFQKLTEVFELEQWIATNPQGAILQFALCACLYNVLQVLRQGIAETQNLTPRDVSIEMVYVDLRKELQTAQVLLPQAELSHARPVRSVQELRRRLQELLDPLWSPLWRKTTKPRVYRQPSNRSKATTAPPTSSCSLKKNKKTKA